MHEINARENHCVLVIAPFVWAKAPTFTEAFKLIKKEARTEDIKGKVYSVFFAPKDVCVNGVGGFSYHKNCPVCGPILEYQIKRKRSNN